MDDYAALLPILNGLTSFHLGRAEYGEARQVASELLRVAESVQDASGSCRCFASAFAHLGRGAEAREVAARLL